MKGGLMFAIAITWCVSTEYIVLEFPQILPYVFVAQILPLLLYRIVTYYHRHWHHYTLELCYFSNALLIVSILRQRQQAVLCCIQLFILTQLSIERTPIDQHPLFPSVGHIVSHQLRPQFRPCVDGQPCIPLLFPNG